MKYCMGRYSCKNPIHSTLVSYLTSFPLFHSSFPNSQPVFELAGPNSYLMFQLNSQPPTHVRSQVATPSTNSCSIHLLPGLDNSRKTENQKSSRKTENQKSSRKTENQKSSRKSEIFQKNRNLP